MGLDGLAPTTVTLRIILEPSPLLATIFIEMGLC